MKLLSGLVVALTLVAAASPLARADEQVSNPQFTSWTKFGVGSTVTLAGTVDAGQVKVSLSTKRTLKEKADDHIVVEIVATTEIMGESHASQPKSRTIPAKVESKDLKEIGSEKVEAAGKTYDCKIYQWKDPSSNTDTGEVKVWVSDAVPGGVVKMDVATRRGNIVQVLKSVEIK